MLKCIVAILNWKVLLAIVLVTSLVQSLDGQVTPETLKSIVDWRWPSNAIQLEDIHLNFKKQQGFTKAKGQLPVGGW